MIVYRRWRRRQRHRRWPRYSPVPRPRPRSIPLHQAAEGESLIEGRLQHRGLHAERRILVHGSDTLLLRPTHALRSAITFKIFLPNPTFCRTRAHCLYGGTRASEKVAVRNRSVRRIRATVADDRSSNELLLDTPGRRGALNASRYPGETAPDGAVIVDREHRVNHLRERAPGPETREAVPRSRPRLPRSLPASPNRLTWEALLAHVVAPWPAAPSGPADSTSRRGPGTAAAAAADADSARHDRRYGRASAARDTREDRVGWPEAHGAPAHQNLTTRM